MIELIAQDKDEMAQWFWDFHGEIVPRNESQSTLSGHATLPAMPAPIASLISRDPVIAFIALGANLGDAAQALSEATAQIGALPQTHVLACSSLYRTAPMDSSGPDYINAVLKISTACPAYFLLSLLQKIEQAAGRQRPYRNAPRTLDLDLLLYGHAQIESDVLTVPHPRMAERAFVLVPLQEIAPELVSAVALRAVADQSIEKI